MSKTNYKTIFLAYIPIGILLLLVLIAELKPGGSFRGYNDFIEYTCYLIAGVLVFLYTTITQIRKIIKKNEIKEAKIILMLLVISSCIAISLLWFPIAV